MQKKIAFFLVIGISAFAMGNGDNGESDKPDMPHIKVDYSNPYSDLSSQHQETRKGPQDKVYLEAMIKGGVKGITEEEKKEKDKVESLSVELKKRTCSSRGWSPEQANTVVAFWDKAIDDENTKLKSEHQKMSNKYQNNCNNIQSTLNQDVKKALKRVAAIFGGMEDALSSCERGDQNCYDRFGAPSFDKMSSPQYRNNLLRAIFDSALSLVHETTRDREGISLLTVEQLEEILCQDKQIADYKNEIKQKDKAIEERLYGKKEPNE